MASFTKKYSGKITNKQRQAMKSIYKALVVHSLVNGIDCTLHADNINGTLFTGLVVNGEIKEPRVIGKRGKIYM